MGAKKLGVAVALIALGGVFLLVQESTYAQKVKGKTRAAETKFLMRGIVQTNCAALGKLLKDGPADDKAWETALCHTMILNEMSYTLMEDGRCPDGVWAGAAKTLRECSAKVMECAHAKDKEGAQAAFKKLTASCASCHTAHKPKS